MNMKIKIRKNKLKETKKTHVGSYKLAPKN